jgi:DNA-binding MarR family transcriptional regulator
MAAESKTDDLIVEIANDLSSYTKIEKRILRSLPDEKAISAYKLASDLLVLPSVIRDNIDLLEKKGLIDKNVQSESKLDIEVQISPKGKLAQKILRSIYP